MYSNTLTLSTDLRFNLNPSFRMSLKSFRYPSNSTSFRSPQFTKMPGTGGTGAYGDVSDGEFQYYCIQAAANKTTSLQITPDFLQTMKRYNVGKSLYWRAGGVSGDIYFRIDDKRTDIYPYFTSEDREVCGAMNADWLWRLFGNGTKTGYLIHEETDNSTNGQCHIGFVSGKRDLVGAGGVKQMKNFTMQMYKNSYLSKTTSSFTTKYPCDIRFLV